MTTLLSVLSWLFMSRLDPYISCLKCFKGDNLAFILSKTTNFLDSKICEICHIFYCILITTENSFYETGRALNFQKNILKNLWSAPKHTMATVSLSGNLNLFTKFRKEKNSNRLGRHIGPGNSDDVTYIKQYRGVFTSIDICRRDTICMYVCYMFAMFYREESVHDWRTRPIAR